jgi:hypothetical protein
VLGSTRAEKWLSSDYRRYPRLADAVSNEQDRFDQLPEDDWTKSAYNGWLFSLRPLLEEADQRAPEFARTEEWQDKQLNTAMGSWTQLRHDTILYGKQTVVPSPFAEGPGLVEPAPAAFGRLADLSLKLHDDLDAHGVLTTSHKVALLDLYHHFYDWDTYANKVSEGRGMTAAEQGFVHRTGLWLLEFFARENGVAEKSPMLVADVASDSNTGNVLHEGTGRFWPIVVVYEPPGEKSIAGIGFAYSHYEFVESDWNRLTDEDWEARLAENPPEHPPWVYSILPGPTGSDAARLYLPLTQTGRQ